MCERVTKAWHFPTIFPLSFSVCQEDVFIIEHPDLQDGSTEPWPEEVVAEHVREFVRKNGVNTVRRLWRQRSPRAFCCNCANKRVGTISPLLPNKGLLFQFHQSAVKGQGGVPSANHTMSNFHRVCCGYSQEGPPGGG